jgi:hypothetical protein
VDHDSRRADWHGEADFLPVTSVKQWFGEKFTTLHPLLQNLHLHGGTLSGVVEIQTGTGLGKLAGTALARKFSIPTDRGSHPFTVNIFHRDDGLHWHRSFDGQAEMQSLFVPIGTLPDGYWIESKGPIRLALTVDIIDGGWYWRCRKIWLHGVRMPVWLLPRTTAYKRIEAGRYRFHVAFSLPLLGAVLSYGGLLNATIVAEAPDR